MINYDELDEQYESLPSREKIAKSNTPVGSLTDNARKIKPVRDSSHKRVRELTDVHDS